MPQYCINKNAQSTGEREVHNLDAFCRYLPDPENRLFLGKFDNCHQAISEATKRYKDVDGCYYCAPDGHSK